MIHKTKTLQNFLQSRQSLINSELQVDPGFSTSRKYTELMDKLILDLFSGVRIGGKKGIAIMALGSYGRRELCLGSDIDLLIIHRDKLTADLAKIISNALYPLWDAKLEVGHSVLTVQECMKLVMSDFRFLTSLVDGRFVMGSIAFYHNFNEIFWKKIEEKKRHFLEKFLIYRGQREKKYNNQAYFVEPDIKEGLGGLRDLHLMAWVAKIYFQIKHIRQIKQFPVFSHFGLDKLYHSENYIFKIRNHLHLLAGNRREDRLLFSYQKQISRKLGYENGSYITGPEKFMRKLYFHLNRIKYGSEEFHVKALEIIDPQPVEPSPAWLPSGFLVKNGKILLKREGILEENPLLILKGFLEAGRRDLSLGPDFIWEAGKRIVADGKKLLENPKADKLFLELIFSPADPKILRIALEIELISLFIPEYKKIRNLAQYNYYHTETVDLHSLKTLEEMQKIARGFYEERWPLFKKIFDDLKHPEWLFMAGLLHDIGKGYRGGHSKKGEQLIPRILSRLGMTGDVLDVISFLVRHHFLLADISQKRDLNDEKTSVQVAHTVKDEETLELLFFLTIADSISTGPLVHSDWKVMLLIELFLKVRHIFKSGTLASPDVTKSIEEKKEKLLKTMRPRFSKKQLQNIIDQVPTRYLLNTPIEDVERHFRLALNLKEKKLSWNLEKLKHAPVTRVIQCTYDKPGLFSKMVGVFTLHNIEVLSTTIFTLKNGLAFDIYEVTNPLDPYRESEIWDRIYREALLSITDEMSLDEKIRKKNMVIKTLKAHIHQKRKVRIDNNESDFFTIIEVVVPDHIGRLYELAKKFFSLGLNIRFAKVTSIQGEMAGVFYVRDSSGRKIYTETQIEDTKNEILSVLN